MTARNLYLVFMPELVTRVCQCGCGRSWRCLETSKSRFYSEIECNPKAGPARLEFTNTTLNISYAPKRLSQKPFPRD